MYTHLKNCAIRAGNFVKTNAGRLVVAGSSVALTVAAHAEDDAFAAATTKVTGAGTIIGAVAASLAGIAAGVMVWKKVAKYFNKAG